MGMSEVNEETEAVFVANPTIAVLGAGKIGEALMSGLLHSGYSPEALLFTERHAERATELTDTYGIRCVELAEAATGADVLVVAVKPQDIDPLLAELATLVDGRKLVLSLCAGLPTELFERRLGGTTPVVRAMPNTPMVIGEAMCAISPGKHAGEEHVKLVEQMLSSVGEVVTIPEDKQDAVTALSGSGPAYVFFLVEAMIDAGILLGLPRNVAEKLIIQSTYGGTKMLAEMGEHPVTLREAVTSPGGTTINAIRELENHGVRAALLAAIESARDRSAELGQAQQQHATE